MSNTDIACGGNFRDFRPGESPAMVVELETAKGRMNENNRHIPLPSIQGLRDNIQQEGQLIPGIVHADPTGAAEYVVDDGCRRFLCCRLLGKPFKAVFLDHVPDEAEVIRISVASNTQRKNESEYDLATKYARYIEITGKTQDQAAKDFGFSASRGSKLRSKLNKAVEEVRQAEIDGLIVADVGRIIASLPMEHQSGFLHDILATDPPLTRDAIQARATALLIRLGLGGNGKPKSPPFRHTTPGGLKVEWPADMNPDILKAEINRLMKEWRDRFNPG